MRVTITRFSQEPKQTLGMWVVKDSGSRKIFSCCTLELPWKNNQRNISCIPAGIYRVVKRWSKKYGWHFHVLDVEGRSWILTHWGNFYTNTRGCILVGTSHKDINADGYRDVTSSRYTMKRLLEIMPDEFEMEVQWSVGVELGEPQ